jgi:hypothetical protein
MWLHREIKLVFNGFWQEVGKRYKANDDEAIKNSEVLDCFPSILTEKYCKRIRSAGEGLPRKKRKTAKDLSQVSNRIPNR